MAEEILVESEPTTFPQPQVEPQAKSQVLKYVLFGLLGLLLLGGTAYAGYWWGIKSVERKVESEKVQREAQKAIPTLVSLPTLTSTPLPEDEIADWKTYIGEYVSFRYPQDWIVESPQTFGSRSEVDFKYNLTTVLVLSIAGNYNNATGQPFVTLKDFLGDKGTKAKEISVGGYQAKRITDPGKEGHVIPYEEVVLFVPDNSFIVSLYYQVSYYERPGASQILDQILSTFKFLE